MRTVLPGLAVVLAAAAIVSGGSGADSVRHRYFPADNRLLTVERFGTAREVSERSLGSLDAIRPKRRWPVRARPLGRGAPGWARRMYARSLLVLHALTGPNGAVVAGPREGWAYVWPRDAGAAAIAYAAAGYRDQARRVARFLLGLDLTAAARFHPDGSPVEGRAAQGDAAGWVDSAAQAVGLRSRVQATPWRDRPDYQEGSPDDYLANALAGASAADGTQSGRMGRFASRRHNEAGIRREFGGRGGTLAREAGNPDSGLDSAVAWAVRPFPQPRLYPLARRTLLRLVATGSRYGLLPSQDWDGGRDPWTAPTAWSAWSLAALAGRDRRRGAAALAHRERRAALHLIDALRRDATPTGLLPERVDAHTGVPTSTTPLAWSHAFAILAIRELWPGPPQPELHQLLHPADRQVDAVCGAQVESCEQRRRGPAQDGRRQRPSQ